MKNASDISSEEELLQLRAEGKISDAQYEELLGAIRKAPSKEQPESATQASECKAKHKGGRIAFTVMLVGFVLPVICFLALQMSAPENVGISIGPWFYLSLALEMGALVMGILAWPDMFAKAAVITIAVVTVIALLFMS